MSGDPFDIRHLRVTGRGDAIYDVLIVRAGKRTIEVVVSPTGRSVRVYVDGQEAK